MDANVVIEKEPGQFMTQHGVSSDPKHAFRFPTEKEARDFLATWPVKAPNARFLSIDPTEAGGRFTGTIETEYDPFGLHRG